MDNRKVAVLFEQHNGLVFGTAARIIGDRDAAADVAQEVWCKLLRSAGPENNDAFIPWLVAVTKRAALDHLRREQRLHDRALECYGSETADNQKARIAVEEALAFLDTKISALPSRQKQVASLRLIEGLSVRETAEALGIAEGTVRATLSQVLPRLKDAWDDRRGGRRLLCDRVTKRSGDWRRLIPAVGE